MRAGDSLASIAAAVYGDSALWYKIAGSNGLTGAEPLTPGTNLTLPAGITRSTNNAASFKPYDPARAIGDVSPNTPSPPKGKDCGIAGQILLVAIAVAVSLALPGGGTVISAAFNAAVGTAASQGVGIITGIQKGFDLKGIAISALTAGIGKGLGSLSKVGGAIGKAGKFLNGTGIINKVAAAVTANALTQGIATVTGLQKKFSFTGIAAAAIGAAAGHVVGNALASKSGILGVKADAGSFGNKLASSAASAIANAATRSAIQGSNFGDNLIAAIPDVIGSTIGNAIGGAIGGGSASSASATETPLLHQAANDQVANDPASNINHGVGANVAGAVTQGGGAVGAKADDTIVVTAPQRAPAVVQRRDFEPPLFYSGDPVERAKNKNIRFLREPGALFQGPVPSEAPPVTQLPSDESVRQRLDAEQKGTLLEHILKGVKWIGRGGAIVLALTPETTGGVTKITVANQSNLRLSRQDESTPDGSFALVTYGKDGEKAVGRAVFTDLENVLFVDTLDGDPGQFVDSDHNAIIIRNIGGQKVGFGVSITTRREAEIYNNGIANGRSSNEITREIQDARVSEAGFQSSSNSEIRYDVRPEYDQVRNQVLQIFTDRGIKLTQPNPARFGKFSFNGRLSEDGKAGFRVEFDPQSGAHINVFIGKEKLPYNISHIEFEGSRQTVDRIVRRFNDD